METLTDLRHFVEHYPQVVDGEVQYAFVGGTAIRLHQEQDGYEERRKRPITDFDLLVFGEQRYPVHSFSVRETGQMFSLEADAISHYQRTLQANDETYHVMNGSFLTAAKLSMVDHPREKDFYDVSYLERHNHVHPEKLHTLFSHSLRLTRDTDLVTTTYYSLLEEDSQHVRMFQAFPSLVNLLDEFSFPPLAFRTVYGFTARNPHMSGHAIHSVLYDTHAVLKELRGRSQEDRMIFLDGLLSLAETQEYIDFDHIVHNNLVPLLRYAPSVEDQRQCFDEFVHAEGDTLNNT